MIADTRSSTQASSLTIEQLLEKDQRRIYQVALHMMGNVADAEDMMQESCIRIMRSMNQFKGESSFSTWAGRITANVCLDELRRRKRRPLVSLEGMMEAEVLPHPEGQSPEVTYERTARMEAMHQALSTISPEHRMAIILRDVQGRSYEEIATILDININTVKSRIARGRLAVREQLMKQPELFGRCTV